MSLLEYDMEPALEIAGGSGEAGGLIKGEEKGDRRGSRPDAGKSRKAYKRRR